MTLSIKKQTNLGIPYEGYTAKETKHLGYLSIGGLLQGVDFHIIFYVNDAPCCTAQHVSGS